MTAIGEVVNIASRVEQANKEAGTRLLVSDAVVAEVEGRVEVADFIRMRLSGTAERMTLHEIAGLTPDGQAALELPESRDTMHFAGRTWTRMFPEDTLDEGAHRVVQFADRDVVFLRREGVYYAFNNACPHLHIPLFESRGEIAEGDLGTYPGTDEPRWLHSEVTEDRGLVCRWHKSCFDLQTGDIRDWTPDLRDGMSPGWEFIGEMSKNPARLQVFPCQVRDGHVWVALG
jgi:nitrite reductase/ring-hydroxylating ferredoxin subunit